MKCLNLICLLLLTTGAMAMEKDPNDDAKNLAPSYKSLDFSDEKLFQDIAEERLRLIEKMIKDSFCQKPEKIISDLESLKNTGKITEEYAEKILECTSILSNPMLFIKYPENPNSSDYKDSQANLDIINNFIEINVPSNSKAQEVNVILKFEKNVDSEYHQVAIERYVNRLFLFPLTVAIEAAELCKKGLEKLTISEALNYVKEYVIGSMESINLSKEHQYNKNTDGYQKLISDMDWSTNILKTKLSQESDQKTVIHAIKEILKFPSKVIRDMILDPYAIGLNENNVLEEVEKMERYAKYTTLKKPTSFKYQSNKDLINAMVNFLYNKGMLDVSLKTDFKIENLPKNSNTVKYYYENFLKDNEDNSTVYGIHLSYLDEDDRLKEFEDLEIEEKPLQKEELPKYEEKITKKEYNQEKIVAKYSKYNPEYSNKKHESKSFGLLIGEKAKKQMEEISGTNAENYINKILLEIKDAVPSLVKNNKVGATAGNFEKLRGISNIWEFRITDPKFSGEIGLNNQSRILFSIQKDTCCILYIGDHPTSTGYKIIEEQNKELLKTLNSN